MADSKQRIRDAALSLFNERGYDAVSLRDVAREAGLAIGTLTYHYKRKEDLLDDLLSDLHAGFEARLDESLRGHELLAHLHGLFVGNEANQARYPFYFKNLTQVAQASPSLLEEERRFEERLLAYYRDVLRRLGEDGMLRPGLQTSSLDAFAYALVTLHATWVTGATPYANDVAPKPSVSQALSSILEAFLADDVLDAYRDLCCESGIDLS